jgi:hypothetical protein
LIQGTLARACYELFGLAKLKEWNEKHIRVM